MEMPSRYRVMPCGNAALTIPFQVGIARLLARADLLSAMDEAFRRSTREKRNSEADRLEIAQGIQAAPGAPVAYPFTEGAGNRSLPSACNISSASMHPSMHAR